MRNALQRRSDGQKAFVACCNARCTYPCGRTRCGHPKHFVEIEAPPFASLEPQPVNAHNTGVRVNLDAMLSQKIADLPRNEGASAGNRSPRENK